MADIEKHIKKLKGKRNNLKVSVVLYDNELGNYHFIYKINKAKDTCLMGSTSIFDENKKQGIVDVNAPFISQLNEYFGNCTLETTSQFVGMNIVDVDFALRGL